MTTIDRVVLEEEDSTEFALPNGKTVAPGEMTIYGPNAKSIEAKINEMIDSIAASGCQTVRVTVRGAIAPMPEGQERVAFGDYYAKITMIGYNPDGTTVTGTAKPLGSTIAPPV